MKTERFDIVALILLAILLVMILYTRTPKAVVCPPPQTAAAPACVPIQQTTGPRDAFNPDDRSAFDNQGDRDSSDLEALAAQQNAAAAVKDQPQTTQVTEVQKHPRRYTASVAAVPSAAALAEDAGAAVTSAAPAETLAAASTVPAPQAVTETSGMTANFAGYNGPYLPYNGQKLVVSGKDIYLVDSNGNGKMLFQNVKTACDCYSVVNDTLFCKDKLGRVSETDLKSGATNWYVSRSSGLCQFK